MTLVYKSLTLIFPEDDPVNAASTSPENVKVTVALTSPENVKVTVALTSPQNDPITVANTEAAGTGSYVHFVYSVYHSLLLFYMS